MASTSVGKPHLENGRPLKAIPVAVGIAFRTAPGRGKNVKLIHYEIKYATEAFEDHPTASLVDGPARVLQFR